MYPILVLAVLSVSACALGQQKKQLFHDAGLYTNLQFTKGEGMTVAPQLWAYKGKMYLEMRYNYEEYNTASLYVGHSFKFGSDDEVEIIPMLGTSVGRFNGVSPATTINIEAGWIRGFSQNQYSVDLKTKNSNFFYTTTGVAIQVYGSLYMGAAFQNYVTKIKDGNKMCSGSMISIRQGVLTAEGFIYNFWRDQSTAGLGLQYSF